MKDLYLGHNFIKLDRVEMYDYDRFFCKDCLFKFLISKNKTYITRMVSSIEITIFNDNWVYLFDDNMTNENIKHRLSQNTCSLLQIKSIIK